MAEAKNQNNIYVYANTQGAVMTKLDATKGAKEFESNKNAVESNIFYEFSDGIRTSERKRITKDKV